jgi:hypothetical protein
MLNVFFPQISQMDGAGADEERSICVINKHLHDLRKIPRPTRLFRIDLPLEG